MRHIGIQSLIGIALIVIGVLSILAPSAIGVLLEAIHRFVSVSDDLLGVVLMLIGFVVIESD